MFRNEKLRLETFFNLALILHSYIKKYSLKSTKLIEQEDPAEPTDDIDVFIGDHVDIVLLTNIIILLTRFYLNLGRVFQILGRSF